MVKTLRPALGVVLLAAAVAGGLENPITVEDLMRLRTITDVRISPDGKRVAYVLSTPSFETDAHEAVVYLVPATGGEAVRLTHATRIFNRPLPLSELRWSPNGSVLAFLGEVGGLPQVHGLPIAGGEPSVMTSAKNGVTAYEWSPDGTRLAYLSEEPASAEEDRRRRDRSFVIEVDRQYRPARVWVQPVAGGPARAITPLEHFVTGLSWAPDGSGLAYSASTTAGWKSQFATRLYYVPHDGGASRTVLDRPGMNTGPRYSPDGQWIAFTSTAGRAAFISTWGLHIVRATGPRAGETRNLSAKSEAWAGDYAWLPDSRSLIQAPVEGTAGRGEHMFERPLWRVSIETGEVDPLTTGRVVSYSPSLSRDATLIAYRSVEPRTMGDVEVLNLATRTRTRISDVNPELRGRALGDLQPIRWTSFDGMEIWGLLLTPPGYKAGARIPLVVYCHGGPIGGVTYGIFPQFMHRPGQIEPYAVEALAGAGMAVLMPMPRGGSGYGERGFGLIVDRWGVDDYKDIMAGVDHLIRQGIADPDRLGVMGASYGGFMTSWIVTQTGRFKAASTGASITDLADLYFLSDAGDPVAEYFGLPWEHPEKYAAHSAVTHAGKVTTPLLIQHGENDRRVPLMQAQKFYQALKRQDKVVELEIYPRAGHLVYEPDLEREQMKRNVEWFKRWLKP